MTVITQQDLDNAVADLETLEDVVNRSTTFGGDGIVHSRLGANIKTLAKVIDDLASVDIGAGVVAQLNIRLAAVEEALNDDTFIIPALTPIIPSRSGQSTYTLPNIDTTTNTLVIPDDTIFQVGDTPYTLATDASVDLTAVSSSTKRVFYDTTSSTFTVVDFNDTLPAPETKILIAAVRASGGRWDLSIACNYLIDGVPSELAYFNYATPEADGVAYLSDFLVPVINSRVNAPLNLDTATRTVTITDDTIFFHNGTSYIVEGGDKEFVLSGVTSHIIYLDTRTGLSQSSGVYRVNTPNWVVQGYNDNSYNGLTAAEKAAFILIAVVRLAPNNTFVAINGAHSVDGVVHNGGLADVIVTPTLTETHVRRREQSNRPVLERIAHRGAADLYPENTILAFKSAATSGLFDALEGDVRFTSDGVPVFLHDATVDRTTNGTGAISGMTLAAAQALIISNTVDERIPTLEDVLTAMKKLQIKCHFQLKTDVTQVQADLVDDLIRKTGMRGHIGLSGPDNALTKMLLLNPEQRIRVTSISKGLSLRTYGCPVDLSIISSSVSETVVKAAHNEGINVLCYTVDDPALAVSMAELGVDGIMTDILDIRQVLIDSV